MQNLQVHTNVQKLKARSPWHAEVLANLLRDAQGTKVLSRPRFLDRLAQKFAGFVLRWEKEVGDLKAFLQGLQTLPELVTSVQRLFSTHAVRNERVKSNRHRHHARDHAFEALRFLKGVLKPFVPLDVGALNVRVLLHQQRNLRKQESGGKRRVLLDDELERLESVLQTTQERLIFTLLRQIALRTSALLNLRVRMLVDASGKARTHCSVPEKLGQMRHFRCSASLQERIQAHYCALLRPEPEHYILRAKDDLHKPLSAGALRHFLKRIGSEARITDVELHAHMFRHTLVTKLVECGNSLEVVARFMGHEEVQTTERYYWLPTAVPLINPFLPSLEQEQRTAALEIFRVLWLESLPYEREALRQKIPHFEEILDLVRE